MISEHRDFYVSERRNYHYEKNKRIVKKINGNIFNWQPCQYDKGGQDMPGYLLNG